MLRDWMLLLFEGPPLTPPTNLSWLRDVWSPCWISKQWLVIWLALTLPMHHFWMKQLLQQKPWLCVTGMAHSQNFHAIQPACILHVVILLILLVYFSWLHRECPPLCFISFKVPCSFYIFPKLEKSFKMLWIRKCIAGLSINFLSISYTSLVSSLQAHQKAKVLHW